MKLTVEIDAAEYERIASGESSMLTGRLLDIEVRQTEGLLAMSRSVLMVEGVTNEAAHKEGIADGAGPAIRVFLRPEEKHDGQDADAVRPGSSGGAERDA